MCVQALPLILSAVGTATQAYNQGQAQKDQAREAAAALRRNAELRGRAGQRVGEEIAKVEASNPDAERAQTQAEFMAALRKAKLDGGGTDLGGGGDAFLTDVASASKAQAGENANTAATLARIDAPTRQREREARGFSNLGTDLSVLGREAAGQDFMTRLRMSLIKPNEGLDALGSGLTAFGNAYGQRAQPNGTRPLKLKTMTQDEMASALVP